MAIEVASAAVRIVPDMTGFAAATQAGTTGAMRGTAAAASRLGGVMSAAVTLPVAAIGVASVKAFADFDDAMIQSLAIMGDVSDALKGEMAAAAKEVAVTTTFSAKQAAESYFFLASAGLDAEQSIAALPAVARFAQAGMFDMALATDLATDAQSALGLVVPDSIQNLKNMTRITDVLVKANTLANASVEQFSKALTNRAGPALRAVGKDIEEGVAVLAAFADQGIKGEEAGTRLDIVMRELQRRAIENKDAFAEMGVTVFDAEGEMVNMADIIEDLEDNLEGASDEQKRMNLAMLGFSDRSVSSLLALIGTSDAIRTYEAALRDAAGITKEVSDKQLESFTSKMKLAKNRIEVAAIALGAQFAPAVASMAAGLAAAATALSELPGPLKNAIVLTLGLAALAGPLLLLGGRIAQATLAMKVLQAQQLATAASAVTLAGAEATAGVAIAGAGRASIGAAGAAATSGAAYGISRTALLGGGAAAAGAGGARGFVMRALGLGSGAGAARTTASLGKRVGRGLGIAFVGELTGSIVQALPTEAGTIGDAVKDTAANAVKGAALGAAIGSVVPALGTGVGAAVGGVVGGAIGFFRSRGERPITEGIVDTVEAGVETAVSQLQGGATDQLLNEELDRMLSEGLSIEEAGAKIGELGVFIDEAIAGGLSFDAAVEGAKAAGLLVSEAVLEGVEEGMSADEVRTFFEDGFRAGLTFDQIVAIAKEGGLNIGNAVSSGVNESLSSSITVAFAPLDGIPDIFAGKLDPIKTVAASKMLEVTNEIQARQGEFTEGLATLGGLGMEALAAEFAAKGPAALGEMRGVLADLETGQALDDILSGAAEQTTTQLREDTAAQRVIVEQFNADIAKLAGAGATELANNLKEAGAVDEAAALAADLPAAFRIEADLAGVATDNIGAFVEALSKEDVETAAKIKAGDVTTAMGGVLSPAAARSISRNYSRILKIEIDADLEALRSSAAARARAVDNAIRAALSGSSGGGGDPDGPGRAGGGRVRPGKSYVVGEEGEEVFTTDKSGFIIANDELQRSGGGGGVVNHISVEVNNPTGEAEDAGDSVNQALLFAGFTT